MKKVLLIGSVLLTMVSCSPSSPKGVPFVPKVEDKISEVGDITKESFRPNLDILFVIDDSGSMGTHQQNLSNNIGLFADAIVKTKFLDYHVGVITSSEYGPSAAGKLQGNPRYVERSTKDGLVALANNLLVGINGDSNEEFFEPMYQALTPPLVNGFNSGFLRQDSYLAIIIVTDTDDQSPENFDAQYIYNFLVNLKGGADRLFVGAAYIPDSEVNTCYGEEYEITTMNNLPVGRAL